MELNSSLFSFSPASFCNVRRIRAACLEGNASHTYTYGRNGARATADGVSYVYDDLGRSIRETEGGTVKEYTYDAADNRKTFILKQDNIVKVNTSYG